MKHLLIFFLLCGYPCSIYAYPELQASEGYVFKGSMIKIPVKGYESANAYEVRSKVASKKYLIVFHEWWGLNEHIKKEADQYAADMPDVNVIALDYYDGQIAKTANEAEPIMNSRDSKRIRAIIEAAFKLIPDNAQIATLGWSLGGEWSMQAALMGGHRIKACVVYYGMPENNVDKIRKLWSDMLFIWCEKDRWITRFVLEKLKSDMTEAGKKVYIYSYGLDHAFTNPNNPKNYSKQGTDDARQHTLDYLRQRLK